ncbi:hypothetical protein KVJ58_000478 [Listeria monocytogenes]|uniref:hypothetical protein n=1 Tax=Listeria monocytogenes TaxID=1639 RepID=UPI00070C5611|nr:hypothetical protein [Listeria monocytogenes]EAC8441520.1 hypothetical protein [Listeria monocytogenes]EAD1458320.1 hypothetical protein [Listeria monocytogenes]EAD1601380.1 hypothetical protein [Listeria monocytogenes]EAD3861072.1 hypothetical protein [Listeria monocytogenes]EAE6402494.1 hypothetical protein [Listeria monocytogenes]
MAKFEVLKKFKDKETKEVYEKGTEIELTVKRADEVADNLGASFLKRLDEPKKDKKSRCCTWKYQMTFLKNLKSVCTFLTIAKIAI